MIRLGVVSLSAYPVFVPESTRKFGGSEVQLGRLCRAVAAHEGWRVELLTSGEGDYCQREVDGVLIRKLPWSPQSGALAKGRLALALRGEIARTAPDLFLQRCLGIETGMVGLWCKRKKRPFIYMTASDWDCDGTYDRQRPAAVTRNPRRWRSCR